jgi:hypothetical protein
LKVSNVPVLETNFRLEQLENPFFEFFSINILRDAESRGFRVLLALELGTPLDENEGVQYGNPQNSD